MQELPRQPLYRVTFHQQHVWEGYTGSPQDTVDVEVYQAWLTPASKDQFDQQQHHVHHQRHSHEHEHNHHGHGHGHQHGDPQAVDHGDHVHEGRTVVEQPAIDLEGEDDEERSRLSRALVQASLPGAGHSCLVQAACLDVNRFLMYICLALHIVACQKCITKVEAFAGTTTSIAHAFC